MNRDSPVVGRVDGATPHILLVVELSLEVPVDAVLAENEGLSGEGGKWRGREEEEKDKGHMVSSSGSSDHAIIKR